MEFPRLNIRAVIFDVYGTLLEVGPSPPDADERWRRLFSDFLRIEPRLSRADFSVATSQVTARYHEVDRGRAIPWPEVHWPSVVTEVVPELSRLSIQERDEFLFRQVQTSHTTRMTAEAAATLRWLQGCRCLLGIASNAQAYTLRELAEALAVHSLSMELFEPQLCFWSFEHGFSKPDPHAFQILAARMAARAISARQTLMVGDRRDNDIEPAQAHGWRTWTLGSEGDGDWARLRSTLRGLPPKALS